MLGFMHVINRSSLRIDRRPRKQGYGRNRVQMFISCPWLCDPVGWFSVKTNILRLVFLVGPISHNNTKLVPEKAQTPYESHHQVE